MNNYRQLDSFSDTDSEKSECFEIEELFEELKLEKRKIRHLKNKLDRMYTIIKKMQRQLDDLTDESHASLISEI